MKELIEKFITENNLDLSTDASAFNSTCCILSGYALYIGIDDADILSSILIDKLDSNRYMELERVFNYAQRNNYEKFWITEEAHKQYKF